MLLINYFFYEGVKTDKVFFRKKLILHYLYFFTVIVSIFYMTIYIFLQLSYQYFT